MANVTTVIVNKTKDVLKVKVGNHHAYANFASIEKDGQYKMQVAVNETYREFFLGVDSNGKKLIVTSDDCCDYECITIKEADGKFDVHQVPRTRISQASESSKEGKEYWFSRIRQLWRWIF